MKSLFARFLGISLESLVKSFGKSLGNLLGRFGKSLVDADSMLAAGGFYKGTTLQLTGNLSMMILYGLDLWSMITPMLTPWWQQGATSLRALLKRLGALT
jgi:hypothetical protein